MRLVRIVLAGAIGALGGALSGVLFASNSSALAQSSLCGRIRGGASV